MHGVVIGSWFSGQVPEPSQVFGSLHAVSACPRRRKMLLDHARYDEHREEILAFPEEHEQQRTTRAA